MMFTRLPFGIHSAVAKIQNMLFGVLVDLSHVNAFLDDDVIGGCGPDTHDKTLEEAFCRMCQADLCLNKKFWLSLDQVIYLGHQTTSRGGANCEEEEAIIDTPTTTDDKSLMFVNYYSTF